MPSTTTYVGWGTGPWGRNGWGAPQLLVTVDGVSATASVGSVTVQLGKIVSVTGVSSSGGVGSVTV
jgi:hypothetical protein